MTYEQFKVLLGVEKLSWSKTSKSKRPIADIQWKGQILPLFGKMDLDAAKPMFVHIQNKDFETNQGNLIPGPSFWCSNNSGREAWADF